MVSRQDDSGKIVNSLAGSSTNHFENKRIYNKCPISVHYRITYDLEFGIGLL